MNVLLVNANQIKPCLAPVGLLYLSSFLKSKGHGCRLLDLGLERDLEAALKRGPPPDLLGVSIRNIDSTQMRLNRFFLPDALAAIRELRRRLPGVQIVLGGAGFSLDPIEIMKRSAADYGIAGEGEEALLELIRALEGGAQPRAIAGLVYRQPDGRWTSNPPRDGGAQLMRTLPFQDLDAADYASYYDLGGMASLQTKRGCALSCAYCTYPLVEGRYYRLMPPERIADEMEFFLSKGFDYFHFTDSVFNVPRAHALGVCREIARRRLQVRWHAYMSPAGFDAELALALARAGNDGVLFGVDSCSEKMLRELGKGFRRADIARASAACRGAGLEFSYHVLFGAPGETLETAEDSLRAVDDWRPAAAFLTQGIRVYRGTPVHRRLLREGKLEEEKSLLEPYYYLSEALPPDFPERVRRFADERGDFVFSDMTVKSPSTDEAVEALYKRNFRGPCWKVLTQLKREKAAV